MTFSDALTRVIIRAALYITALLFIVAVIANTPGRVSSACVDTAGMPGRWDCSIGHRVDAPMWSQAGAGLELPLR